MKLTKTQRDVLQKMADAERDEKPGFWDLTWSKGGGWWWGYNHTTGSFAQKMITSGLVSRASDSTNTYERWHINERGRRALQGLPPFRDENGVYHDTQEAAVRRKEDTT